MIAGTFVLEEHTIQFCALDGGRIEYTVRDGRSGSTATTHVDKAEFSAAMHVALNGDDDVDEGMYALAGEAMPRIHNVHGATEMSRVGAEKAIRRLRWIP
jgi:hypothetical protein